MDVRRSLILKRLHESAEVGTYVPLADVRKGSRRIQTRTSVAEGTLRVDVDFAGTDYPSANAREIL